MEKWKMIEETIVRESSYFYPGIYLSEVLLKEAEKADILLACKRKMVIFFCSS